MRLGEGKTRLLQSSRAIDDTAISTSTQLADNMTHLVQRACLPSLTSTKKPSTQPTHGFCSVIKLDKNEKKNGSFLPALSPILPPRALNGAELKTFFLSSWNHYLLHPGEKRKRGSRTGTDQKQKGKRQETKNVFRKNEEEKERYVGHCLAPIIHSEESLFWKISPVGSNPKPHTRGVGGQWQQLPGVGC